MESSSVRVTPDAKTGVAAVFRTSPSNRRSVPARAVSTHPEPRVSAVMGPAETACGDGEKRAHSAWKAITVTAPEVADIWSDLGALWLIEDQYLKQFPVCRWAQPAVAAAHALMVGHGIDPEVVTAVEVTTFHEAARLAVRHPTTTEQAQYSLPFPVAATVVQGEITPETVTAGLADPAVNRLSAAVTIVEDDAHNDAFPARRFARVALTTSDGRRFESPDTEASGDPHTPLTEEQIVSKFRSYAGAAAPALEAVSSVPELLERAAAVG